MEHPNLPPNIHEILDDLPEPGSLRKPAEQENNETFAIPEYIEQITCEQANSFTQSYEAGQLQSLDPLWQLNGHLSRPNSPDYHHDPACVTNELTEEELDALRARVQGDIQENRASQPE